MVLIVTALSCPALVYALDIAKSIRDSYFSSQLNSYSLYFCNTPLKTVISLTEDPLICLAFLGARETMHILVSNMYGK